MTIDTLSRGARSLHRRVRQVVVLVLGVALLSLAAGEADVLSFALTGRACGTEPTAPRAGPRVTPHAGDHDWA